MRLHVRLLPSSGLGMDRAHPADSVRLFVLNQRAAEASHERYARAVLNHLGLQGQGYDYGGLEMRHAGTPGGRAERRGR